MANLLRQHSHSENKNTSLSSPSPYTPRIHDSPSVKCHNRLRSIRGSLHYNTLFTICSHRFRGDVPFPAHAHRFFLIPAPTADRSRNEHETLDRSYIPGFLGSNNATNRRNTVLPYLLLKVTKQPRIEGIQLGLLIKDLRRNENSFLYTKSSFIRHALSTQIPMIGDD